MKLKSVLVFLIIAWTSVFYPISNAKSVDRVKDKFIFGCGIGQYLQSYGGTLRRLAEDSTTNINIEIADVFSNSDEYINFLKNRDFISKEDADDYLTQIRARCKDFYREKRDEFLRDTGLDSALVSEAGYSHILSVNKELLQEEAFPQRMLNKMAKSDFVKAIYIDKHEEIIKPANWFGSWEKETLPTINGEYVSGVGGNDYFSGKGVNVGIIEALYMENGLGGYIAPEDLKKDFPDMYVEAHKEIYNSYGDRLQIGDHALKVARVVGNMAPKINLYTGFSMTDVIGDIQDPVNFMIENNVSVINCSFGLQKNGEYCWEENYFNQTSLDNLIVFVVAAGNDKGKRVSCPANAANVIAVGATDAQGDEIADYSNYGSAVHSGCKPNLVANGAPHLPQDKDPFHSFKGTSFAAPMITGAIAMQLGIDSRYKLYVERLIPNLYASANDRQIDDFAKNQFGLDAKAGAGMLDLKNFLD